MNIRQKIGEIRDYFIHNRYVGHSQLVKKMAAAMDDAIVICSCAEQTHHFKNAISMYNLSPLRGQNKAMLLDNHTTIILLSGALDNMEHLEREIRRLMDINGANQVLISKLTMREWANEITIKKQATLLESHEWTIALQKQVIENLRWERNNKQQEVFEYRQRLRKYLRRGRRKVGTGA